MNANEKVEADDRPRVESLDELDEGALYAYAGSEPGAKSHTFRVRLEWVDDEDFAGYGEGSVAMDYLDGYVADVPTSNVERMISNGRIVVVEEVEPDRAADGGDPHDDPTLVTDGGVEVEERPRAASEEVPQKLVDDLVSDEWITPTRSRAADAAMYLNGGEFYDVDVFPIRDPARGRWIVEAESDSLDGARFVSKWVEILEDGEECPTCGNTRERRAHGTNGVVDWHRETCTVCGHVHDEDAG